MLLDRSLTLDRFGPYLDAQVPYASLVIQKQGRHWYSWYPIGGPLLSTPLYLPIVASPAIRRLPPASLIAVARIAEKMIAGLFAAGQALGLLAILRRLTSERAAWMLTLVFAVGTGAWSTCSQALWQHTYGVPVIIGCLYAIQRFSGPEAGLRWFWLAGLFAGCAIAIRPSNVALLAALAAALWAWRVPMSAYIRSFAFPAMAAVLTGAYNLHVFGNPFGGYETKSSTHMLTGLAGLLISPARGLLVYTPIVAFALCAFAPSVKKRIQEQRALAFAAAVFACVQVALVSLWPVWWGGYCWGPRMLTEILPAVMILIALGWPAVNRARTYVFAAAIIYGIFIQAVGVYCYPKGHWDNVPESVDRDPARLWNWADNPIDRTVRGGIAWEPYEIIGAAVKGGLPAASEKLRQLGISAY